MLVRNVARCDQREVLEVAVNFTHATCLLVGTSNITSVVHNPALVHAVCTCVSVFAMSLKVLRCDTSLLIVLYFMRPFHVHVAQPSHNIQ